MLCFAPFIAYSDEIITQVDNKTIIINMTSINPVTIQENITKLKEILTTLNEENQVKLETILSKDHKDWNEGDIIIASSTIFAFFTFGSILTIKYENPHIDEENKLMDGILLSIMTIQCVHLLAILIIIFGWFSPLLYANIIIITVIFLGIIVSAIRTVFSLGTRDMERTEIAKKSFDYILSQLGGGVDLEKKYFDLRREFDRVKRETGE